MSDVSHHPAEPQETRAALEVRGLSAWHPDAEGRFPVASGIDLEASAGQVLGVFGPNGCGKSTLLRALAGIHSSTSGQVLLQGRRPGPVRRALVPQGHRESFFEWASLSSNVLLTSPGGLRRRRERRASVEKLQQELGLSLDLAMRPSHCSDGMLQQAALLRALYSDPDLLLADEPFSALDVAVAARLRAALRRTVSQRGMVAVVVLHDVDALLELCDRVLVIPGRPYATADADGAHRAHLITNRHGPMAADTAAAATRPAAADERFVATLRRLLEGEPPP